MKYQKVLIKISGEALAGNQNKGIDFGTVSNIATQLKEIADSGVLVSVVCGGGNLWRGAEGVDVNNGVGIERSQGDYIGMLGTIMNALALESALTNLGADARVLTSIEIPKITEFFTYQKATHYLQKGRILIFGGGTGLPYFSTDSGASLRASELGLDAIIMAKNGTDGVYDKDPNKYDDAIKFDKISYDELISKNLKIMDATATAMCRENKIKIVVCDMNVQGNMYKAATGENIGTIIGE